MTKYQLKHERIRWPHKCATCGASATATVETSCSVVTGVGYFVLFVRTTHLRTRIRYPICARHLWVARVAGTLSARNLFNLSLGVLVAFPAMVWIICLIADAYSWLFEGITISDPQTVLVYTLIVAIGVGIFPLASLRS